MVNLNIPENAPVLYVTFSAEINPSTTESLIAVMSRAAMQRVKQVHLALSTPGGQVREGMNLYNILRGMPFDLATHNIGSVDSIGNAVFLAGKSRYATANSTFMFHGVGFTITQATRLEEQDVRDRLDSILADQKRIGTVIADNSNLNPRQVAALFRTQQTKDVSWAVEKGIVHAVRDLSIPLGSPIVSLVFQR